MRPMPCAAILLIAIAMAPAAHAQGIDNPDAPTTLYFHLSANQDFPINTQPPDDRYASDDSRGLLAPTTSCVPDPTGQLGQLSKSFHTLYGFSTPGYVEYDFQEEGGPRIHPERGLASDVLLDPSSPAKVTWYLETDFSGGDPRFSGLPTEMLPAVVPEVVVQATIRTGDDISIGAEAYNKGTLIAQGRSEPLLLAPTDSDHYLPQPDGTAVYRFDVPLTIEQDTIPADESYNVRIDIMMDVPGCNEDPDAALMSSQVLSFTSPELRPRLEWSVRNPLSIEYIHPQFVGEQLLVHMSFQSPWGNYDVDEAPGGIEVTIDGPSEARSLTRATITQRFHEHGHHFEPVDVTYAWPYKADGAKRGEYTLTVTAWNDQRTASATGTAGFEIGPNVAYDDAGNEVASEGSVTKDSPAVGLILLMGLLAAVLVRRR